ncbi:uncharacterized protein LOC129305407 [Prosopis cineraria]|uniref:uncharacterized protein LOC129305407 n=1 Tax=Prosopis cineraria TaxID=364024 RepID=UPI0024101BD7|nr:uncharacterized protein LOC129305407 [Prosopis cineraria]
MKVDGACAFTPKVVACGGLIHNSQGAFIAGFMYQMGDDNHLFAELWVCYGLRLAWNMGYRKIILESNSTEALRLIVHAENPEHMDFGVIMEVKHLMGRNWKVDTKRIVRDRNKSVDFLAK